MALNENDDFRKVLRDLKNTPDGRACLIGSALCGLLAVLNAVWPVVVGSRLGVNTGKWVVLWLLMPVLLFLLQLRAAQLFDFGGRAWQYLRVFILVAPIAALMFFNFKE